MDAAEDGAGTVAPDQGPASTGSLVPCLCVGDGRAALAWYAEALGAQVGEPWVDEDGRIVTMALEVEDCAAALERVRAAGGTVTREPDAQTARVVATFLDSSGHRWMLVEER